MCGFLYSIQPITADPDGLALRGPDSLTRHDSEIGSFVTARLTTNPQSNSQPYVCNDTWIQLNGTIYNTPNEQDYFQSIVYNHLDSVHEAIANLNGEFAIVIANEQHITIAKDCFGTKPLYFYYDDHQLVVSSVRSVVADACQTVYSLPANTIITFSRGRDIKLVKQSQTHHFDLTQKHTHWDYVHIEFEKVMDKMTNHPNITGIPVSSGIDSGIIDCWCNVHRPVNTIVSHIKGEDVDLIKQRHSIRSCRDIPISHTINQTDDIRKNYGGDSLYLTRNLWNKGVATIGAVYQTLSQHGIKIALNGCGGDDIYSDYAYQGQPINTHSTIGGWWPKDLETVYPWWEKYKWLEAELFYNDFIGGLHGLETRFPLIDKNLVQAWLNTTHNLKNSGYKAWICHYLDQFKYPYNHNKHGLDDE